MKNTYEYWSRACADHALRCPHCGAAIDVAALVAVDSKRCGACGRNIPALERRTTRQPVDITDAVLLAAGSR